MNLKAPCAKLWAHWGKQSIHHHLGKMELTGLYPNNSEGCSSGKLQKITK